MEGRPCYMKDINITNIELTKMVRCYGGAQVIKKRSVLVSYVLWYVWNVLFMDTDRYDFADMGSDKERLMC